MRASWRTTIVIVACSVVALVAAYWGTAVSMFAQWRTSTYSHQLFVVPVAIYLVWRRRQRLRHVEPEPSWWVLALLPALACGWLVGEATATFVVEHFCLVAMVVVLIWGEIGTRAARVLAAPLLFLFFAVPLGDSLIPLLQDYSAWFAVKALEITRVPVLLEGRLITIPSGRWEVAEACSGIHYLLASVTIGFIYADITYRSWKRKAIFLAASVVVPVIANGFRVYAIVLTDYLGGTHLARSADHITAGWIVLSLITVVLFAMGMKWREEPKKADGEAGAARDAAAPGVPQSPSLIRVLGFALVGVIATGAAPTYARISNGGGQAATVAEVGPVKVSLPWVPTATQFPDWEPKLIRPDALIAQSYTRGNRVVELRLAYYGQGRRNAKLVSSSNLLYGESWERTAGQGASTTVQGVATEVRQTSIRSNKGRLVLWSWYWVNGEFTSNAFRAKWLMAWAKLTRRDPASALIVLATDDQGTGQTPRAVLLDFCEHLSLPAGMR